MSLHSRLENLRSKIEAEKNELRSQLLDLELYESEIGELIAIICEDGDEPSEEDVEYLIDRISDCADWVESAANGIHDAIDEF